MPAQTISNGVHTNGHLASSNGHSASASHTTGQHVSKPPQHDGDGFSTRAIHIGSSPSSETGAVIPSISLSTTYAQSRIGTHKGYEYSRSLNPNRHALETQLAGLEANGWKALAFASGSAATATVLQAMGPKAHVLCINDVYGGTFRYMSKVAGALQGVEVTWIDFDKASDEEVLAAIRPNTRLIWIETPTNPTLRLPAIPHLTSLVHTSFPSSSRPLIAIDATFLSPFFLSPLTAPISADLVLHSLTKYINGHSDVLMGAVILPTPSDAPNGNEDTINAVYSKLQFLQNAHGAVPSAFDAWLAQRGAKTLALRMKAHATNAIALARFLLNHPLVKDVVYPGLGEHSGNATARQILSPHAKKFVEDWERRDEVDPLTADRRGKGDFPFGGMISFRIGRKESVSNGHVHLNGNGHHTNGFTNGNGVNGVEEDAGDITERFLTHTRLFTLAESLGGVESLAEMPERMTHGSIPPAERLALGITPDLIRLSVGVEDVDDLIKDVEQALEWAVEGWKFEAGSESD